MWQVDNDRYQLWRLEHELAPKKIDRLLDHVTVTDRPEAPILFRLPIAPMERAVRGLYKRLCDLLAWAHHARQARPNG